MYGRTMLTFQQENYKKQKGVNMLFFRLTLVPIQEGKMGDAISYAEEKVDEFMLSLIHI